MCLNFIAANSGKQNSMREKKKKKKDPKNTVIQGVNL